MASILAGCAGVPRSADQAPSRVGLAAFSIEGRFALRYEEKNYSGRLSWRHDGVDNELLLSSPFGQGIAQLNTDLSGASITTSDGKTAHAQNAEALTREVLGYPLPIERLVDWIAAKEAKASGEVERRDALARPLQLRHQDWRIDYTYESDDAHDRSAADALPSRIFVTRADGFELRLRIDEWTDLSRPAAPVAVKP